MTRPSVYQAATQSLLASALIFAAAIGYWSVASFQTSSADVAANVTANVSLGWTLIGALIASVLVSLILLYRHFQAFGRNAEASRQVTS